MRSAVRKMGNSSGIIIPKPMLDEMAVKAGDEVELTIEDGVLVVKLRRVNPRAGWAEDARAIAAIGDDAPILGEFGDDGDDALTW